MSLFACREEDNTNSISSICSSDIDSDSSICKTSDDLTNDGSQGSHFDELFASLPLNNSKERSDNQRRSLKNKPSLRRTFAGSTEKGIKENPK